MLGCAQLVVALTCARIRRLHRLLGFLVDDRCRCFLYRPLGLPLALDLLRLFYAWQAGRIEVGHVGAQLLGLYAKSPPKTVIVASPVNDNEVAPVAAGQHIIAAGLKRVPESGAIVGVFAC